MAVKSAYSWEDFLKELDGSGLRGQFSDADMRLAQANPDVGMSLLGYKKQWNGATTDAERQRANEAANALRSSYGGYTAGTDGASFLKDTLSPRDFTYDEEAPTYTAPGSFSYKDAPTYDSRYDDRIQQLLDAVTNREKFSYDVESDPLYSQYRKQYLREGRRAAEDTMGQAAAMSGGLPSSYASTAAGQAANYYNAQLTDKVPELEELAYQKYLNDFDMDRTKLSAVQSAEQADYQKYLDALGQYNTDRSFAYGQYADDRNFGYQQYLDQLGQYNADRSFAYGQFSDELARQRYDEETAYQRDWEQNERDYQRGRDALADQRYAEELAYQRSRDALSDQRYADETAYQRGRDTISDQRYDDELSYQRQQDARERALEDALMGAQYGDYSGLSGLGYDTSGYQSNEQRQRALQEAELYAQYGDFSKLRELGVDTASYEAQLAAAARSGGAGGSGGSGSAGSGGTGGGSLLPLIANAKTRSEVFDIIYAATNDRLVANQYAEDWEAGNKKPETYTGTYQQMYNDKIETYDDAVMWLVSEKGMSKADAEGYAETYMGMYRSGKFNSKGGTALGTTASGMAGEFMSHPGNQASRASAVRTALMNGTITEEEAEYLLDIIGA